MNTDFITLFNKLTEMPYMAHWFYTLPASDVLNGVPSDCSDRAYVLGDWCEQHDIDYGLLWCLFTTPSISLHVCIIIEGYVYDPIWKAYEYTLNDYKQLTQALLYHKTGRWIRRIL